LGALICLNLSKQRQHPRDPIIKFATDVGYQSKGLSVASISVSGSGQANAGRLRVIGNLRRAGASPQFSEEGERTNTWRMQNV
jgi:hypothetical protein